MSIEKPNYFSIDKIESQKFIVPIKGHDPRNLLSGHYVLYELKTKNSCHDLQKTCACFYNNEIILEDCEKRTCSYYIKGDCKSSSFYHPNLHQYYFPEKFTSALKVLPPQATLEVEVGENSVKALQIYIGNETLETWAEDKLQKEK